MKRRLIEDFFVFLLMCGVAVAATWPLVDHFFAAIPCQTTAGRLYLDRPGDSLQLYYWFWLLRDNLLGTSGFMRNPYEFNMSAASPPDGPYMYPFYFLYLLFTPLGDIGAYNALVLVSYVLTGLFTYLLVREYTDSRLGALLAALIYTLVPLRIINLLGGHLNGFIYYLIPAILFFFEKMVQRGSIWAGVFCGLCVFWLSLLEVHLIYYMCVLLAAYMPLRLLYREEPAAGTGLHSIDRPLPGACDQRMWLPLVLLYLAGIGLTVLYQVVVSRKFFQPFFSVDFWVILGLYPILFLFFVLLLTDLLARLTGQGLRPFLWFSGVALSPLALLPLVGSNRLLHLDLRVFLPLFCTFILLLVLMSGRFAARRYLAVAGSLPLRMAGRILAPRIRGLVPVACGLLLAVAWVLLVKKVFFAGSIAHGGRTIQDVKLFSPHLADLYTRGADVYLGLVPLLLILYMLVVAVRQFLGRETLYDRRQLSIITLFSCIFLLAFILGAGLSFGASSLYIPFFHYFPFFNYPRVPDRIMTIAFLAGAVLAGFAVRDMLLRFRQQGNGVVLISFLGLLAVLTWYDFGAQQPVALTNLDRGQTVYDYISEHIDDKLLLELPLWPGDSHQSSLYEYYITLDRVRRVNGYTPIVTQEYVDRVYKPLSTLNRGFLDRAQYELLRKMGVRFITVHDNPDVFPAKVSPYPPLVTVRHLMSSPFLEYIPLRNMIRLPGLVRENRKLYLFRVKERAVPVSRAEEKATCRYFIPDIYTAAHLSHVTGRLEKDPRIGSQVLTAKAGRDRSHYLNYGPYVELPPGDYEVYFELRSSLAGSDEEVARLEVAAYLAHEKQKILVQRELSGKDFTTDGYQAFTLRFSLDRLRKMEFRTWYSGKGDLRLEKVVVTCADQDRFDTLLEAESLLGETGFLVNDPAASAGKAVHCSILRDPAGRMVYGPYRKYPAGSYEAIFYLRAEGHEVGGPGDPVVAGLSVTTDNGRRVLVRKMVRLNEIRGSRYRGIPLRMTLDRDNEVSFNVRFDRQADLFVDRIAIRAVAGPGRTVIPATMLLLKR